MKPTTQADLIKWFDAKPITQKIMTAEELKRFFAWLDKK